MKNAKIWIALLAVVLVVGLMAGIYFATRETPNKNTKTFTLVVIHGDGSQKTVTVETDKEYLSQALLDEKLIVESDSPGKYDTVDGETADYNANQSWWRFLIDGQEATEGMNTTVIKDGSTYTLEYKIGW